MKPIMYIFLNRGLGMSTGKSAAQASHAAVEAYRISEPEMIEAWMSGKHYTKIILMADDEIQLGNIKDYIEERGFKTALIVDEGRTEIRPFTKTALGVQIVDKDVEHVADTFSGFSTFKLPGYYVHSVADIVLDDALRRVNELGLLNRRGKKYLAGQI